MEGNIVRKGIIYIVCFFVMWGLFLVYWKFFEYIFVLDILVYWILWLFVFMCVFLIVFKKWKIGWCELCFLKFEGGLLVLFFVFVLIFVNWFVYIWVVNYGFLFEVSFGYYINLFVFVFLGILFLKEKLNRM